MKSWISPILLVTLLLILAFAFQGSRGLFSPDEGFYVCISQEMVNSGEYLIPHLQGAPWLDKPPLSMWGVAMGLKLLGKNEWGARAFHGICFLLTTALVFLLGQSFFGQRGGPVSAIIFSTMLIPFIGGHVVTPDMPLTLFATAVFFCFYKSISSNRRSSQLWKSLMFFAFGLGFLTKGPAMILPASAIFLFLLFRRRIIKYFFTPWTLLGIVLFFTFGLSWYVYTTDTLPGALAYFWDNQIYGRAISTKYARNPGLRGALIYIPVILLGALPWSFLWPGMLKQRWRIGFDKSALKKTINDTPALLLTLWICAPLLILCLASSKLPLYSLPIFPALALLTAGKITSQPENYDARLYGFSNRTAISLLLWVMLLVGLKIGGTFFPTLKNMKMLHTALQSVAPNGPYEIIPVNEHLEGLGFYNSMQVEQVTTQSSPYPFFVLPEHAAEEVSELKLTEYAHVFICRNESDSETIRRTCLDAGIPFQEASLPFERRVIICDPGQNP